MSRTTEGLAYIPRRCYRWDDPAGPIEWLEERQCRTCARHADGACPVLVHIAIGQGAGPCSGIAAPGADVVDEGPRGVRCTRFTPDPLAVPPQQRLPRGRPRPPTPTTPRRRWTRCGELRLPALPRRLPAAMPTRMRGKETR